MEDKKYLYDGKVYCDTDLSEEIDNYGGDTYDLYYELKHNNLMMEVTYYSTVDDPHFYDDFKQCFEESADGLGIEVLEDGK